MKQIVCLSTSPWYPIPTRKQQVMSRLKDAEVLYFDPPVTWIAPLRDPNAKPKLKAYRAAGERVRGHVTAYALPPVWPFFNKYRAVNRRNQKKTAAYVKKRMAEAGFDKPVLWCYSPVSADAVDRIPHSALVYDCVDRHSAYGGLMNPALVDEMELELARKADMVFATAEGLSERLRTVNPRAMFLPNGANYELFQQAAEPGDVPEDMQGITGPVFGFVGALQECIEYGFVTSAAKARPEWNFVWIGRENPGVDLSGMRALPNVRFLGLKPHDQLPRYIACFDACLNLFASSALSKDVSPLKFYEYLATGKPIVSTPQPDQIMQFAPLLHIARTAGEFETACAAALEDTDPARKAARMEEGRKSSWDARVEEMERVLGEMGIL